MTDGYTVNMINDDPESLGVKLLASSSSDGVLYCKYTQDAKTILNKVQYDLQNTKYYLLLAQGPCK